MDFEQEQHFLLRRVVGFRNYWSRSPKPGGLYPEKLHFQMAGTGAYHLLHHHFPVVEERELVEEGEVQLLERKCIDPPL
jgi:hypothetical protein